jgi:hypothetical protein
MEEREERKNEGVTGLVCARELEFLTQPDVKSEAKETAI